MNIKLKGSRLEVEVDKCRGECNWDRLSDLMPSIRNKNSGFESLSNLIEGELILEKFLEQERETCVPKESYYNFLRNAERLLKSAAISNKDEFTTVMESYLLLAKLHFFSTKFLESLEDIEKSKIDAPKTQFITLRSLKLAAECYAIKGFALESTLQKQIKKNYEKLKILGCFETSVKLSISYIAELHKTINSKPKTITMVSINRNCRNLLGKLLEMALERAPYLLLRKSINEKCWDLEGIEWYRQIMTELSDKTMVEYVQQKLCRRLAEVLIRGMLDSEYDFASRAINLKLKSLRFYTGSNSNYFAPKSRFEEVILLLMISEIIATQLAKINKTQNFQKICKNSNNEEIVYVQDLKMIHNLLVFVLSNLRQYNLLKLHYERSMVFANEDRHMWFQFSLILICDNRFFRALKTLKYCNNLSNINLKSSKNVDNNANNKLTENSLNFNNEDAIIEQMLAAKINLEQLSNPSKGLYAASKATSLARGTWLAGRCMTLFAFALSEKAEREVSFEVRKKVIKESIESFERAIQLDPHDDLAHFLCALQYALARDLTLAQEKCQMALDINTENPSAIMLMALIFTAKKDFKSALELVINALVDFPTHYGLLILRLKLEAKYGRIQEALHTSKILLTFWKKITNMGMDFMLNTSFNCDNYKNDVISINNGGLNTFNNIETSSATNSLKTPKQSSLVGMAVGANYQKLCGKESLIPVTPMFTSPLGIAASSHISLANSCLDMTETNSVVGQTVTIATNLSDYGGTISTLSNSGDILSSSNKLSRFPMLQIQANIWVELAEFLLEVGKINDAQLCVEEICAINPNSNSYQALYLKGRLFLTRVIQKNVILDEIMKKRFYAEAKKAFLGALSIFPAHTQSLIHLSNIYAMEGNLKMAEKALKDVIDIDPLNCEYWHLLGRILAEEKRIEEANECFQTANSLNFNTPIIPFNVIPRLVKPFSVN